MWKPTSIFISCLCVVDAFFVSYAVGLNSRQVLVVDTGLAQAGAQGQRQSTSTEVDKSQLSVVSPAVIPEQVATEPAQAFTDLGDTEERLQPSLKTAALAGILDPAQDKKFRPNDPVTRADFTRWMDRVRQIKPFSPDVPTYKDVPADHGYYADIEGATNAYLVQGYNLRDGSGKEFKPEQNITREEFAVMYGTFSGKRSRAEGLSSQEMDNYLRYNPEATQFGDRTYKDLGDVNDWARKWVATAHQAGVLEQSFAVNPYDQRQEKRFLHPQKQMTRAEAVNILVKLYGSHAKEAVTDKQAQTLESHGVKP